MKVLIGTPVHQCKDYSMKRWLENVATLQRKTPADLLLMDNSLGLEYVEMVKKYCLDYAVLDHRIEHFEIDDTNIDSMRARSMRVELAQEMIRREVLKGGYDAWFSWECDQIIPANALDTLIRLMQSEHSMMIVHNSWSRTNSVDLNTNMGCALISQEALRKSWFLPERHGEISTHISDFYDVDETMFKKRLLRSGGNYIEVYGVITPIYHLNN